MLEIADEGLLRALIQKLRYFSSKGFIFVQSFAIS